MKKMKKREHGGRGGRLPSPAVGRSIGIAVLQISATAIQGLLIPRLPRYKGQSTGRAVITVALDRPQ